FMAVYALGALPLAFVLYAAPLYLGRALGLSQAALGHWLWIPPLGWEIGYFFWGWFVDRMPRTPADDAKLFALLALGGLPLALVPSLSSFAVVMAVLFWAMFISAGFIIGGIAYATRVLLTRQSGLIAGLGAGSWSAMVALTMPLFGRLFDAHAYGRAFVFAALVPVAGFTAWTLARKGSP
ncbi:MAG TPA: hypothetical protein VF334_02825, partial [Polyangia bacterium]